MDIGQTLQRKKLPGTKTKSCLAWYPSPIVIIPLDLCARVCLGFLFNPVTIRYSLVETGKAASSTTRTRKIMSTYVQLGAWTICSEFEINLTTPKRTCQAQGIHSKGLIIMHGRARNYRKAFLHTYVKGGTIQSQPFKIVLFNLFGR